MSLPMMSTPTFKTIIPSSNEEINYRPFLVKEEKILLIATEGGDTNEMVNATKQILENCIVEDIDADELTAFDIEYLFLKLRGKSVGEVVELRVGHTEGNECEEKTDIEINLDDINVQGLKTEEEKIIMVTDKIGCKVRYPTSKIISSIDTESENGAGFQMMSKCIAIVFDEENVYEDFTEEEMNSWLENLSQEQFQKISEFFETLPQLKHEVKWKCKKCGKDDSFEVAGLQSFFT